MIIPYLLLALLPYDAFCLTFEIYNPEATSITMYGPGSNYTFNSQTMIVSGNTPGEWSLASNKEIQPFEYTSALTHRNCYYFVSSIHGYFQINDRTDNGCTCKVYNCNEEFVRIYATDYLTHLVVMVNEGNGWRELGISNYTIKQRERGLSFIGLS